MTSLAMLANSGSVTGASQLVTFRPGQGLTRCGHAGIHGGVHAMTRVYRLVG